MTRFESVDPTPHGCCIHCGEPRGVHRNDVCAPAYSVYAVAPDNSLSHILGFIVAPGYPDGEPTFIEGQVYYCRNRGDAHRKRDRLNRQSRQTDKERS